MFKQNIIQVWINMLEFNLIFFLNEIVLNWNNNLMINLGQIPLPWNPPFHALHFDIGFDFMTLFIPSSSQHNRVQSKVIKPDSIIENDNFS